MEGGAVEDTSTNAAQSVVPKQRTISLACDFDYLKIRM